VQVRGVAGTGGTSDPSNAQDGTPRKVAGAPGSVTATTGPASLTVHWTAASPGDFRIAGYRVVSLWTTGQSGGAEPICSASATATSCTGPARAGVRHDLVVYAVDSRNGTGEWARVTTGKVPFTAAPPTPDGNLLPASGATAGGVHPGAEMTVSGAGYAPFSTVTVLIYSSPQVLASVAADGSGTFTTAVEVPAGLEAGHHTLVASGLDTSGTLRYLTLPVQVPAKAREKATGNDGSTGSGTLAYTGFDLIAPLTGGGAAVVLGAGLMVLACRRKAD
jgi:titin